MKRLIAPLIVLTLAACAAPVPWTSSTVPKDRWKSDYSACRRTADRDVGWREDDRDRDSGSPFREYDRQQAKKRFDAVLSSCMIDRGYVPASRNKE